MGINRSDKRQRRQGLNFEVNRQTDWVFVFVKNKQHGLIAWDSKKDPEALKL